MAFERATQAVSEATRRQVLQHWRLGLPIAVERNGKLIWLGPEEVEVPPPQGPAGLLYLPQGRSVDPELLRKWLSQACPTLADLVNLANLPVGLLAYVSPRSATGRADHGLDETGADNLCQAERQFSILRTAYPRQTAKLAKRLKAVGTEEELAELLCEAAVCNAIASAAKSGSLVVEPTTANGSRCDLRANLGGSDVWGEVKRYSDRAAQSGTPVLRALSVEGFRQAAGGAEGVIRSRAENLRSKLDGWSDNGQGKGVPDQFLPGQINILFLFEDAWSPLPHVRAALWGDRFFFDEPDPELWQYGSKEGLFARERWSVVSACCWMTTVGGAARTQRLWKNPKAEIRLPTPVEDLLQEL